MSSHDQWPQTGGQQPGGQQGPGGWQQGGWQQPGPYGGQPQFPNTGPTQQGYPQGPYPQQPGYQPQQGYPAQQGYTGARFGAPGPKRRKPWPWLIPLIVVVVAAAVVVPIVLTRGGGGGGSGSPSAAAPALKPWIVTAGQTGQFVNGFGAWASGDDLITVTGNSVTAFKRSDGSKVWSVTPPTQGALFCGASRNVSADRIAVAYGVTSKDNPSNQVCTNLGLINLKTGKFAWSEQYLQASSFPPAGVAMMIIGNSLFAGFNLSDLVSQVDLATGKTKTHDDMSDGNNADCSINDVTGTSTAVYFLATCQPGPPSDPNAPANLAAFDAIRAEDANTGQQTAFGEITGQSAQVPADSTVGMEPGTFVSASPMVVQTSADTTTGQSTGSFVGIDSSLKVSWAVPGTIGDPNSLDILAAGDSSAGWTGFGRAFVANGVLLAETTFQNPSGTQNNKIVAIDAKSGQQKWRTGMPDVAFAAPVGVQGSSVIAIGQTIKGDAQGNPGTVVAHLDLADGKLTSSKTLNLPITGTSTTLADAADFEATWWVAADGRLYGAQLLNGPTTRPTAPEVFAVG